MLAALSSWLTADGDKLLCVLVGALATHAFQLQKGFEGTVPVLRQLVPGRSDTSYFRVDFALGVLFGTIFGMLLFKPKDTSQALAAGLTWVSAVNTLFVTRAPSGAKPDAAAAPGGKHP